MEGEDIIALVGYVIGALMADIFMIASVASCVEEGYPVVGVIMMLPFLLINVLVVFFVHEVFTGE